MKVLNVFCRWFGVFSVLFFSFANAHALEFTELEPAFAASGDGVTLYGTGFDPAETYTVTIAEIPAPVEEVQAGFIRFTVPSNATTGEVAVTEGVDGPTAIHSSWLTVTRDITVQFSGSIPISLTGYFVGSFYGDSPSQGPNYPVTIVKGQSSFVVASRGESDPNFFAITTDSMAQAEFSAESTAVALIFFNPLVFTFDLDEADLKLANIASLPESQSLIQLIQAELTAGRDYIEHPDFQDTLAAATTAYYIEWANSQAADTSGSVDQAVIQQASGQWDDFINGVYSFAQGYPRNLNDGRKNWAMKADRLDVISTGPKVNKRGIPILGVKFEATAQDVNPFGETEVMVKSNPLDWMANLYELDPLGRDSNGYMYFPRGKPDVDRVIEDDYQTVYPRIQAKPIAKLYIGSSGGNENLDIIGLLKKQIISMVLPPSDMPIPADRSGLYMIRIFSGAWYPRQDKLLDNMPGGKDEHMAMLSANIFMAVVDAIGIAIKSTDFIDKKELLEIGLKVQKLTLKALVSAREQGTLDATSIRMIYIGVAEIALDMLLDAIVDAAIKNPLKALSGAGKTIVKIIDITAKVSAVGSLVNRIGALTNMDHMPGASDTPVAQAVESAIVIVGDPWRPHITSFSPQKGYRGTVVRINGRCFSTVEEENIVDFNSFWSEDPDAPAVARARVLEATETSLVVLVPEEAEPGERHISVKVKTEYGSRGRFRTALLEPPYSTFNILDDPIITYVEPFPSTSKSEVKIMILGENFFPDSARMLIWLDSYGDGTYVYRLDPITEGTNILDLWVESALVTETTTVRVVADMGHDFISWDLVIPDRKSDPWPLPVSGGGPYGCNIHITSLADGDPKETIDGVITLREAIGWASGTLQQEGRHPTPGEREHMSNREEPEFPLRYGASRADRITIYALDSVITLDPTLGPLPGLGSDDTYGLGRLTIDGAGMSGDGISISGKKLVKFSVATIRNFDGNGLHLSDTLSSKFLNVKIQDCTGNGIFVEGQSKFNAFEVEVERCQHGIHLHGPGVGSNRFDEHLPNRPPHDYGKHSSYNRGWGMLVDGGASHNLLSILNVNNNEKGGIRITGANTTHNTIGVTNPAANIIILKRHHIFDNKGPGIWLEGSNGTTIRFVRITGNEGDGILVEGNSTGNAIDMTMIGHTEDDVRSENHGSGIHIRGNVSHTLIGRHRQRRINERYGNNISGNRKHGIWLEGPNVHHIIINDSSIGLTGDTWDNPWDRVLIPNGMNGVAITDGAHDNVVGDNDANLRVEITGHTNGAGILLKDSGTKDNLILGCDIGMPVNMDDRFVGVGNLYGVHITNGAHANIVGRRGVPQDVGDGDGKQFRSHNTFRDNEVGILIESGGEPGVSVLPEQTPTGGNVIQNNYFGSISPTGDSNVPNKVGILIKQDARSNRIGGSEEGEGNIFWGNTEAGIQIDHATISMPNLVNRIIGNVFDMNMGTLDPYNPLQQIPHGIGILVTNRSSGHIIGGLDTGEGNIFIRNRVGVYLDNSDSISIIGNEMGTGDDDGNLIAGAIIRNSQDCHVGPGNYFAGNGLNAPASKLGGIAISGGRLNIVIGNWIGFDSNLLASGNDPDGIYIVGSSANIIGGAKLDGNVISYSVRHGISISASANNSIGNNTIGHVPFMGGPNGGAGIDIFNSGSNTIGWAWTKINDGRVWIYAPNTISENVGGGVVVDGPGATGNKIVSNSIYGHFPPGINNVNGGNTELPPPILESFGAQKIFGRVDTAKVPDGSLVQVFTDWDDEGEHFLNQVTVENGHFAAPVRGGFLLFFNATVTDLAGNTSEFGQEVFFNIAGLDIRRVTEPPGEQTVPAGTNDVPVLPMKLTAISIPVTVESMEFTTDDTFADRTNVTGVSLYHDVDRDGAVSQGDKLLGGPVDYGAGGTSIDADSDTVAIPLVEADVIPLVPEEWLLVYSLSPDTPVDKIFSAKLENAQAVAAKTPPPVSAAVAPTGPFPIESDIFTVTEGDFGIFTLSLEPDWNLISIPIWLPDNALSIALQSIDGKYEAIWAYDGATDSWARHVVGGLSFLNNLETIEPKKGYWIKMSAAAVCILDSLGPVDEPIALVADWNLVGFNSLTDIARDNALSSIASQCNSAWTYNAAGNSWEMYFRDGAPSFNNLAVFKPGKGYWIQTTGPCSWDVSGSAIAASPLKSVAAGSKGKHTLSTRPEIPYTVWEILDVNGAQVSDGSKVALKADNNYVAARSKENYIPSTRPKIPYTVWGTVEINGIQMSDDCTVVLKLDNKELSKCKVKKVKRYGGIYRLDIQPTVGGPGQAELYVKANGMEVRAASIPPGAPGQTINLDLSVRTQMWQSGSPR